MSQSIQKVIKIGSSDDVTIPAKELKHQPIAFGDEVEVIIRPLRSSDSEAKQVLKSAQKILQEYKQDFTNLTQR